MAVVRAIISVLSPCSSYGTSSPAGQRTGETFFGKLLGRSSPGVGKFRAWFWIAVPNRARVHGGCYGRNNRPFRIIYVVITSIHSIYFLSF